MTPVQYSLHIHDIFMRRVSGYVSVWWHVSLKRLTAIGCLTLASRAACFNQFLFANSMWDETFNYWFGWIAWLLYIHPSSLSSFVPLLQVIIVFILSHVLYLDLTLIGYSNFWSIEWSRLRYNCWRVTISAFALIVMIYYMGTFANCKTLPVTLSVFLNYVLLSLIPISSTLCVFSLVLWF